MSSPSSFPLNQNPSSPQHSLSINDHLTSLSINHENGAKERQYSVESCDQFKIESENSVDLNEANAALQDHDDVKERENSGKNHGGIKEANVDDDDDDVEVERENSGEIREHVKEENIVVLRYGDGNDDDVEERENSGENYGGIKEAIIVIHQEDDDDVEEREKSGEDYGGIKEANVVHQNDDDDDVEERENSSENRDHREEENDSVRKGDEEERGKELNHRRSGGRIGGGGGRFPLRADAEDCSFYVRTGNCKFGMNCKFNHPPNLVRRVHEVIL